MDLAVDLTLDLTVYGYGAAAVAYTALAVALLRGLGREGSNPSAHRALVAAVGVSALWAWGGALFSSGPRPSMLMSLVDVARYGLWYVFLLRLLASGHAPMERRRMLTGLAYGTVAAAAVLLVMVQGLGLRSVSALLLFAWLGLPVLGLVLLEQLFRSVPEDFRWHAKPMCLALLCILVFDIYLHSQVILFGTLDGDSLTVRPLVHVLACLLLLMAARRHANWMGNLKVSHSVALHTATLIVVGTYLVFISAIGYYVRHFGGDSGRAFQIGLLSLALVALAVLLASSSLRAKFRVLIGKNFFSYRYDYRTEWLRFTAMLTATGASREVGGLIVRGLAGLLQSKGGAIWSLGPDRRELIQSSAWNVAASKETESVSSNFARFLLERDWIIDLEEYRASPARYDGVVIPEWLLYSPQYALVVPLIVGNELAGFVALAPAVGSVRLDWEGRDLLKTAARQAAGFLAQTQATDALLEARKFDAFNRMSAFVVHDLKNIVAQLSLMMQNAKRLQDNPEFRQDMLATVEHSLEKMRQLMLQLRDGAVPAGSTLGVELAPILTSIRDAAGKRGRTLEVDIVDPLVTRGHEERVARVIGHVVQNAIDATAEDGKVWARLARSGGRAQVVVGDTGCGMTPEFVRNRLFKPFSTTKEGGMASAPTRASSTSANSAAASTSTPSPVAGRS